MKNKRPLARMHATWNTMATPGHTSPWRLGFIAASSRDRAGRQGKQAGKESEGEESVQRKCEKVVRERKCEW